MKKNQAAEPASDEMRSHYDFDYSKSRPNRFAEQPKLGRVREVNIVTKGRIRVAVPVESTEPLRNESVRKVIESVRKRRR
jgi:hypothetical protein